MYSERATCVRRHMCIRIHVARPGYMFQGDIPWCKRGLRKLKNVFSIVSMEFFMCYTVHLKCTVKFRFS